MKYASLVLGCSLLLAGCAKSTAPSDATSDVDRSKLTEVSIKVPGMD